MLVIEWGISFLLALLQCCAAVKVNWLLFSCFPLNSECRKEHYHHIAGVRKDENRRAPRCAPKKLTRNYRYARTCQRNSAPRAGNEVDVEVLQGVQATLEGPKARCIDEKENHALNQTRGLPDYENHDKWIAPKSRRA